MMIRASVLAVFAVAGSSAALAQSFDFTNPGDVVTGPSQAAGVWYTDRYNPSGFVSGYLFGGDERLRHSIDAADSASARPGSYSSAFYNTQGRKYDLDAGSTKMSIDLYVPAEWEDTDRRLAGFWGTAVDGSSTISGYPIIEFTGIDGADRFRYYSQDADQDPGNGLVADWIDMGLPAGFAYDSWYTLDIELVGTDWIATVDGTLSLVDNATVGSVGISNVILQGHNNQDGVTYDIYWDNFQAIPAPGSLALLGLAGLTAARRRRA